jgi:N-acetylglucosamine kinase-like BadF-type ATPase
MKYILGVDGGGTKTTAAVADTDGNILAEATSGASSFPSVGERKASENLNAAVFEAAKKAGISDFRSESSSFGFAGLNVEKDHKTYRKIVENENLIRHLDRERVFICNDTRIGLEAGSTAGNKVIIIAGTGSNCFGLNDRGEEAKCSGWDYILADEGSGYEASIKALRAVMRAYDGRGDKTGLTKAILDELGLKDEPDIVNWTYGKPFSKERLGRFARIVCHCADNRDKISTKILREEAEESILSVTTVAERLKLGNRRFDLVFVGGLFKCKTHFKDIVMDGLRERFARIHFKPLVARPVEGAVRLAVKNL